jgi:two-component system OmpR family sensor kinase
MRFRPRTLTSRLVVTAVLLVALVSLLLAAATTLAMRSYLDGRLDDQVREALAASARDRGPGSDPGRFTGVGTLRAAYPDGQEPSGYAVVDDRGGEHRDGHDESRERGPRARPLDGAGLAVLSDVPADGAPHDVSVPGLGEYRVVAQEVTFLAGGGGAGTPGRLVVGLPTEDVEAILARLLGLEAGLTVLAVLAAGGAGLVVVRRQLRPLREVADTAGRVSELPLASGSIELADRVPDRLADERTEVGRVGASLNALLDHVESSLDARHRSEQQVRQFVADASHELRTPLATIAGYVELARRRPHDPEAGATALAKVETESARMTGLVEDLLLLARLDAGRPLQREPVDLTRLLLEAVSDARVLAPDHQWRLALPDEALEVTGDDRTLHQVVSNLLTNARKYTPPGTTVTCGAHREDDRVVVTVHDDGPGFPPALVDQAFERFARGDAARTRTVAGEESGVGLGLALVRAIVLAHGGSVSLDSEPGSTSVRLTLPT